MKLLFKKTDLSSIQLLKYLLCAAIAFGLILYKLGNLTGSLAAGETAAQPARNALHQIIVNPLFLLIKLLHLPIWYLSHDSTFVNRLPSAIAGLFLLLFFTILVRQWYGSKSAFFGFIMLATSPWYLHLSRLSLNDILFPLSLTILLLFYSQWQQRDSMVWFWLSPIINGLVLFTPGFIWFSLIGLIWQRPEYKTSWEKLGLLRKLGWLMLWPVTTLLLIYAFWHNTQLLYSWAGLPQHFASLQGIARNIGSVWTHILFRGFQSPLIGLGYLPLVNVFTTSMALVGGYFYVSHWRATRSKVIFSLILVGTILSGIGGPVSNSINMPVIFLLAAGGIGYLLHEWLKVFPRNPLAKYAGYSLITLSITISVIYNTHQFYIAWPHNTATKIAFSHRN